MAGYIVGETIAIAELIFRRELRVSWRIASKTREDATTGARNQYRC